MRSRPILSWARITAGSGRNGTRSLARAWKKNPAEIVWATTFATAEPLSPQPAPCTSRGHRTAEIPLPTSTYRSGRKVSCTPRIQPLPAIVTRMSGAPNNAIRNQPTAASATSPGPARALAIGTASSWPTTTRTAPTASASQVACTPSATASARRPAP